MSIFKKGSAPTVVLVHGAWADASSWNGVIERLQKEGVQVEYRNYPDMVHGFITMGRVLETANTALADCGAALRKAWGK